LKQFIHSLYILWACCITPGLRFNSAQSKTDGRETGQTEKDVPMMLVTCKGRFATVRTFVIDYLRWWITAPTDFKYRPVPHYYILKAPCRIRATLQKLCNGIRESRFRSSTDFAGMAQLQESSSRRLSTKYVDVAGTVLPVTGLHPVDPT
jgi:hypothetical protein